jgi:hypothetical protein
VKVTLDANEEPNPSSFRRASLVAQIWYWCTSDATCDGWARGTTANQTELHALAASDARRGAELT